MKACGMELTVSVLKIMALALIDQAPAVSTFHGTVMLYFTNIKSNFRYRWIQFFMQAHNLFIRSQTGKVTVSPEKQQFIYNTIAFHLGTLKRDFYSGRINEDLIPNAEETHFVFNMDKGRTIGIRGENTVKYADVTSGGEGITMMVHVSRVRFAEIECPFLIFQNPSRSYPIRNVPNDVPGVCYRFQPK